MSLNTNFKYKVRKIKVKIKLKSFTKIFLKHLQYPENLCAVKNGFFVNHSILTVDCSTTICLVKPKSPKSVSSNM